MHVLSVMKEGNKIVILKIREQMSVCSLIPKLVGVCRIKPKIRHLHPSKSSVSDISTTSGTHHSGGRTILTVCCTETFKRIFNSFKTVRANLIDFKHKFECH